VKLKNYVLLCLATAFLAISHTFCMKVELLNIKKRNNVQNFIYNLTSIYSKLNIKHSKEKKKYLQNKTSHEIAHLKTTNAFWELIIAKKIPVSYRIARQDPTILQILHTTKNPNEIINLIQTPTQGGPLEKTIIEFLYYFFKNPRINTMHHTKILLDQFPELRESILGYIFEDEEFNSFITSLRKEKFSPKIVTNIMLEDTPAESEESNAPQKRNTRETSRFNKRYAYLLAAATVSAATFFAGRILIKKISKKS